ncbi:DUF4864 domain-containing protein [Roseisolibacter agri]|uniref:DUF4864 domain-containing protein n=1 Tax=Roseisolibacter agri TaxID=2014610 RepID=A0AA37Q003_9BACT|nr:DUF4864 domain-containing protein [Roseisolibacter agri]GLC24140.1 hypothetical protein rosag_06530 [Roseisolibacter agri]
MRNQPSVRAARFSPFHAARAHVALTLAASLLLAPAPSVHAQGAASTAATVAQAPQRGVRTVRADAPAPDPRLAPDSVVTIVLEAFARVEPNLPTSGIDIAYAFTAPANRAVIGSVERFSDVVRDGSYRPLLGHRRAVRSEMSIEGDHATQRVVVTTVDGAQVAYTFRLARQAEGEYRGCWMTERVTREPPSSLAPPQVALAASPERAPGA